MICKNCSHQKACERQLDEDGRCTYFIKQGHVEIDGGIDIDPMDTFIYDYEDLQRMIKKQSQKPPK